MRRRRFGRDAPPTAAWKAQKPRGIAIFRPQSQPLDHSTICHCQSQPFAIEWIKMDALFSRLGDLILGQAEPEDPAMAVLRARELETRRLQAKSQRAVLLEDLEHAVRALLLFVGAKGGGTASRLRHEEQEEEKEEKTTALMASTDERRALLLTDAQAVVTLLCLQLDRCARHGLRPLESEGELEGDESATVKFFGVVKWTCTRVEALRQAQALAALRNAPSPAASAAAVSASVEPDLPRHVRGLLAAVRAASALTSVRSDEGKARAFVRQALNTHVLQPAMSMVLAETNLDLLASYYDDGALFRHRDDVKVFLTLLDGLDRLAFAFLIDDPRLDAPPETMPFATERPRPMQVQRMPKRRAPKLIEPEDMVSGRVVLCQEDDETALLAEKLVAHHELRAAFDSTQGGNPLSQVLQRAAVSRRVDDAATAVLRFLELGYPEYDVFATELVEVVCNPFLCGMARFEPALGLPDVVEACFCFLYEHVDTPGLFQAHLDASHVLELRDTVEELGGYHKNMALDAHEVAALLLQYLWELPDPVLTAERLDNWLACGDDSGETMDQDERVTLLRVLANDLPWYCAPVLERVCHWAATALAPCHAARNGLTPMALAHAFAPVLLRERRAERFHEFDNPMTRKYPVGVTHRRSARFRLLTENQEARDVRRVARDGNDGARALALLFAEHRQVLRDYRWELTDRRAKLQRKVLALETLRFRLEESVDIANGSHAALLRRLWAALLPGDEDESEEMEMEAMLASPRWKRSGFHTQSPLGAFRGGGLLALETLVFFVEQYGDKARAMMARNALPGGNRYPFPVASVNVLRMLMRLLMLDEAPSVCSKLVLHAEVNDEDEGEGEHKPATVLKLRIAERVSRTPFWRVFDDAEALSKLHAMAFMLLDLHWIHSGATQMGFQPVLDATRRQMGWLLEQAPASVDDMWATWIRVREQDAARASSAAAASAASSATAAAMASMAAMMFGTSDEQQQPSVTAVTLDTTVPAKAESMGDDTDGTAAEDPAVAF